MAIHRGFSFLPDIGWHHHRDGDSSFLSLVCPESPSHLEDFFLQHPRMPGPKGETLRPFPLSPEEQIRFTLIDPYLYLYPFLLAPFEGGFFTLFGNLKKDSPDSQREQGFPGGDAQCS